MSVPPNPDPYEIVLLIIGVIVLFVWGADLWRRWEGEMGERPSVKERWHTR